MDYLIQIRDAGMRARDLTRQLLSFARKQIMSMKILEISDVVRSYEQMIGRMVGEDIQVNLELAPTPLPARADASLLGQVLMNLAVNARDAMPDGGRLTFATGLVELDEAGANAVSPEMIPGEYIMIAVSDTGTGMDEKVARNCFEPFFTTKDVDKGTGLGLSTVYGVVKQDSGDIQVSSQLGEGTTFKVYLPLSHKGTSPEKHAEIIHGDLSAASTVLVVEDEASVRKLACMILRRRGYTVIESKDVENALALAASHKAPINLVLSDVVMPGMKGPEVFRRIAEHHPEAKLLLMSGYSESMVNSEGKGEAVVPFIQKPFSGPQLLLKVAETLKS
ncbi:MAG: response regulator [Desulfatibacillum sp.]|nr:response regulator [Desulfatibacillum sp.]